MAAPLIILLISSGLKGVHSITTVSQVSVEAGKSVSIPCLYDSRYINHVKYLCEGYYWKYCTCAVKTNKPDSSGKFLISDDKNQGIFTVTIKNLTDQNSHYWCVVEIPGIWIDIGNYFRLSVTRGTSSFYVDFDVGQEIRGSHGGNITIKFSSRNSGKIKWCRLGSGCVTQPSGSIDGTSVSINESAPDVFVVTMSDVTSQSSGWYLCFRGNLQMPVNVIVTDKGNETFTGVQGEQQSGSPTALIISLTFMIFLVTVTLVICFLLKLSKWTKRGSSATALSSAAKRDEDVTYSSVLTVPQQTTPRGVISGTFTQQSGPSSRIGRNRAEGSRPRRCKVCPDSTPVRRWRTLDHEFVSKSADGTRLPPVRDRTNPEEAEKCTAG